MKMAGRIDGRGPAHLRPLSIKRGVNRYAEGSAIIEWGHTVVHCTASVEDRVPPFMRGAGTGWVSAEYSMLPRATHERTSRDIAKGRINGRSSEIQRLIGRALRAAVDMSALGERTIWIDCDVLQADGGTRTASITGAFVCLVDALRAIVEAASLARLPLLAQVAALSVGKVNGQVVLDLCYEEDRTAEVDANVVMNSRSEFVELQGTGEGGFFSRAELDAMLAVAGDGLAKVFALQREALSLSVREEHLFDDISSPR